MPQANRKYGLICDSAARPPSGDSHLPPSNKDTTSFNVSIDRSLAPQAMQFSPCLPCILQQIWEADPQDGPVYISKWYISDAFHRCFLRPADVGVFSYVVPPLPYDTDIYLCVDCVLPMGWVSSPPFFCSASKTTADLANAYLSYDCLPTPEYSPTLGSYSTVSPPPRFFRAVAGNGRLHG